MLKHRCISAALFALALAGCQERGLQPQSQSTATPATNATIATTTSEPVAAEQPSTTATTEETTTTEPTPETVPVTRPRATVPATTARTVPPAVVEPDPSWTGDAWAIPTYIVMCESGGSWSAYNPSSGASGPYQMLPMHFGGELAMNQSRAAQHAKAAELWNGGRGRSHWAACL